MATTVKPKNKSAAKKKATAKKAAPKKKSAAPKKKGEPPAPERKHPEKFTIKKMLEVIANGFPADYDGFGHLDPITVVGSMKLTIKDDKHPIAIEITSTVNNGNGAASVNRVDIDRKSRKIEFKFDDNQEVFQFPDGKETTETNPPQEEDEDD